jgi:4-amino-4-deoxy-L-arabinose transferase-like glycosyltransferase
MRLVNRTLAQAALAAALTAALYSFGLSLSPPHLTHDEIKFALQAKSIADTGRDIGGRLLPLYFQEPGFPVGRDPICIYVMAAVLTILPLSEQSIRLSTVIVGAAGVGLIFILARLVFDKHSIAWIVAAILASSPTYYIHGRLALSVLYPVPFTIAWLIVLRWYLTTRRPRTAFAVGLVLGAGVYSYLAAAVMMPLYFAATGVMLAIERDWRGLTRMTAGFVLLLLPLVAWQAIEPQRYANIVTAYRLYETQPGPTSGLLQQMLSGQGATDRVHVFWDALNPGRLFFTGESSLQISTREVGSLLTPVAVLLLAGLGALFRSLRQNGRWLLVFGLLSAPLPGVLMADVEIRRWLVVLPFIAIVAGYGVQRLLAAGLAGRALVAVLLVLMTAQFAAFTRDYFGAYRERSSVWFGGNIRAAVVSVLADARGQVPAAVYIASDIPWVDAYWQFYSAAQGHNLLDRTTYVRLASGDVPKATSGAILLAPAERSLVANVAGAGWIERRQVRDIDGSPSIIIFSAPTF